jgi:hypothetical protein
LNISLGYTILPVAAPKRKRSLLPLLTVLFLFSYGLLTLLIVEQGSAIQSQSNLIKVLLRDSTELWTAKGKAISDQQMIKSQAEEKAKAKNQTPSAQIQAPPAEGRSSQNSQVQSPSTQSPSTQATPEHRSSHAGKLAKPQTQAPPVPTSDLVDRRRALTTI